MSDVKNINPKALAATTRIPLGLVPDTIAVEVSMAYLEGALKYGRYNWAATQVSASTYHDAMRRHLAKWWNGENEDKKTKVKHLASIIASAGILLDAELRGTLVDDRPPIADLDGLMEKRAAEVMTNLKELFKDCDPYQWSIQDVFVKAPPTK